MDGIVSVTPFAYDTYSTDDWSAQLGQVGRGPDTDSVAGTVTANSANGKRTYVLVYNNSGGTLAAGQALKFYAAFFGTKVDKSSVGVSLAGFAPPVINGSTSNTIPAASYFWMVREGFTSVLKTTAAVLEGDQLETSATAGQVKSNSGTGAMDIQGGTFIAANATASAVLTRAYVNCTW